MSFAWPWSGRSLPQGEPVGVLCPRLGPNVVRPTVLPPPTMWPTWSLTGWYFCTWLVGWPIAAGWLTDWLSNKMSTWPSPRQRHLVAKGFTTLVRLTCGQMYPLAVTSCGQLWYYFTFGSCWPVVRCTHPPRQRHLVAMCDTTPPLGQVDLWSDVPSWAETSCGHVWYNFRSGWAVNWRVRLVPAAAVIPAPLAYIKVVEVKKLVLSLFV